VKYVKNEAFCALKSLYVYVHEVIFFCYFFYLDFKKIDETLFLTDLRQIFDLPETENYVLFVNNYEAE